MPGPTVPGLGAVRALEDVVPPELARDPNFVEMWTPGRATSVMVTVELPAMGEPGATTVRRAGPVRQNQDDGHAEAVSLRAGDLNRAVAEALQVGTPERTAVVRVLVNRSPCTSCSPLLATHLTVIESQLTPEQRASVRFEVLSTGAYEANENIPEEEAHLYTSRVQRFSDLATTTRSIERLLEAGWDTRALSRGGALTERGEWLAGAVDHMRAYMGLPRAGAAPAVPPPAAVQAAPASARTPWAAPSAPATPGPTAARAPASAPQASAPGGSAPASPPAAPTPPARRAPATSVPAPQPSAPGEPVQGDVAAALRGEQPVPPPERIADILRGEPAPTVAPEAGAGGPASELVSARQSVSSPQAARAALDAARALTRQVADLRADPATTVPIPGVPHPVLQAAFDASSLAYDAATGAHQAYDAAYRAAQLADRTGGPAATEAGRHAEATHGLSQRTNGEYQSALAANEAAQQGGPPAVLHAAQATAHAEQAASLHLQAADAAGRAVAAAADAFDIPTPAPAPEAGVMTPDPPSGTTGPATTPEHGDVAAPTQAFPGPGPAPAPDAGVAAVDSPAAPPPGAADRPGRPSTPTSPAAGAVPPAPPLASTPPAPASPGPPPAGTSRGQAAPGPSQAGPAGSGSPAEAGRGQAAPGSAQAGPPPAAAGRGPGARAGEAGEQGLSAAEADRIRAALEPDAPPAAGGAAPPELPPPGPPTGAAAQPAGEPDPGHEIQSAARVVDQARSTLAAIDGQVERLARSAADARQAAPAPAEEAGRAAVATAVQLAYEAAQVAVEVANAAARAAHAAAAVHAGADPVPHAVVEAADAAEYAHHQAQVAVRDYEEVREVVGRAPAAGEGRPRADEVVARAMRTVDSTARAVGAASEALRAAGRALAETGRAADVWPDAAVPEWLRPPGEPAPSRRAPARPSAPGSPGRGSAEFPDLVGDLVFDRPEQLGPAQRAAVQQAIAELLENRTYGDGFTVRVRSVEIGRGSTHFEIAVFSGSREVGLTQHTVRWDGDVLVAHHSLIDVGGVRGRGFGRDWTEHLERWFRASGVDHITLHAVRAGTYAWARLGYRWVDEGQARQILDWLQTLTTGPDTTPSEVAAARELLDRAARFPWGHELFPTIAEIAEIGRTEPRPGLEHVEHLGRRTLTIGWYGRKDLR